MSLIRVFVVASFLIAFPLGATAFAGRIQRNVRDGMQSASFFCHSVVGLSWSYARAEMSASEKPSASHFAKASNEVGAQLVSIYGKDAPKKYSELFANGWNKGMKKCYKSL